ncbi:MAG: aminoglycoside phosphotransferase family protein [Eubacteriales bacterium]
MLKTNNLSPEDAGYLLELSPKLDITFAKRLDKGHEHKFYVQTARGDKRLLRIGGMEHYNWLESDFRMYNYVAASGICISKPVSMGAFREGTKSYQLYTWIDGEELLLALPHMNNAEQFSAGKKTGALMRKLHALPPQDETEPWRIRFGRKVQELIQAYNDKPVKSQGVDLLVRYLRDNMELLDNRPQTFTHGDWNAENLILTPDGQIGIIDLSGDKDYGDPWWEFWLTPCDLNSSAHFHTGQIKGYFEDEPPLEFFRLLSFYISFSTLEFLCDTAGEDDPENVKCVLNWFDNMRNPVPSWYLSKL